MSSKADPSSERYIALQVGEEIADEDGVLLRRVDDSPSNLLEWVFYALYRTTTSVRSAVSTLLGSRPQLE